MLLLALSTCADELPAVAPSLPMDTSWPSQRAAIVRAPVVPCHWSGTNLEGELIDSQGAEVASLRLHGGTFELTVNADKASARGSRGAISVNGVVRTRGLSVWPARRLELLERHAWVDPSTRVEVVTIGDGGALLELGHAFPEAERAVTCDSLWLTPGPALPAKETTFSGIRWITYKNAEVPVFGTSGDQIAVWSELPAQDRTAVTLETVGERQRIRTRIGAVDWDAWIPVGSAESHAVYPSLHGDGRPVGGGISSYRAMPPPPREARTVRATELRWGDSPAAAREIDVKLDVDLPVLVVEQRDGFASIKFEDHALQARRGKFWVSLDALTLL